jgi:gamma-glutamyltranspeptidase/glutathione hydrolase
MYLDGKGEVIPDLSTLGHLAAGVPGSVAGLYHAHRAYGTVPWRDLLAPAVELADRGFEIGPHLAASLELLQRYRGRFTALRAFMAPDGSPLRTGDRLVQSDLARTLARIAECGPDDFYRGETADLITHEMRAGGGLITAEDLASYAVMEREPVKGSYRGYEIISAPPPSSGGTVLLQILNILEGYTFGEWFHLSEQHIHYMVEAEKRAYADRARYLGDPDYVEMPVSILISKEYADHSRFSIGQRATPAARLYGGGLTDFSHEETTHYSIIDQSGNAVSTTTTLNGAYGSKVIVRGAGFLLNNEMDDFSIKPGVPNMYGLTGGEANAIEPGKRMLSSMSPTIVMRDDGVFLVLGTPGGSTIITTVAQVIVNIIDFDMNPENAVYSPRFHHQWLPDRISYERGAFSPGLIARLVNMGHTCVERASVIGDVQLILVEDAVFCGIADPRGGGRAEGIETVTSVR